MLTLVQKRAPPEKKFGNRCSKLMTILYSPKINLARTAALLTQ